MKPYSGKTIRLYRQRKKIFRARGQKDQFSYKGEKTELVSDIKNKIKITMEQHFQ